MDTTCTIEESMTLLEIHCSVRLSNHATFDKIDDDDD